MLNLLLTAAMTLLGAGPALAGAGPISVPEPTSMAILATTAGAFAIYRWRGRK